MRTTALVRATILVLFTHLGVTAPAFADAVTYWNEVTLTAVTIGRPGPPGNLDIALVQAAVHDAVQSIEGKFEPYKIAIEGASGSPDAAAAAAAYGVLIGLYGTTQGATLDAAWNAYLTANPDLVGDPGIAVGQQVAAAMLAFYRAAPTPLPPPVRGCEDDADGCQPGEWRPTPSYLGSPPIPAPFAPMTAPWVGSLTPFTLLRSNQFRGEPPPPLTSGRYVREYNEVKTLGAFSSTALTELTRTPEQTILAYFWTDTNFIAQWHRALRAIVETHVPDIGDRARLFALASLAVADAFITAWESKLHFNFWRPVTAIQEGEFDGNPKTDGDPDWQPLLNTPPYPDYTSGANNLSGAITRTLALFFGTDDFDFTITSNSPNLTDPATRTRNYTRFSQAADEVVEVRILHGAHFRSADEDARQQGGRVAHWVFHHFLEPVHAPQR
jgi:hypothetical protein